MSGLDTLMITFQTQLSDVMETVLKTAMFEVTRLVEDGFLEEVKRRNQEVEALRLQLQWAERRLREQEELEEAGKRVDCAEDDVEMYSDTAEQRLEEQQGEILRDSDVKKEEDDCEERWTRSCQEVRAEPVQTAETPAVTHSPESSVTEEEEEEEDMLPSSAVGVKEEVNTPSCSSVHLGVWSSNIDGETGAESHSDTEMSEVQQKQSLVDKELLLNAMKQDPQIATAYVFHTEQEEPHVAADPPLEVDSDWAGLTTTTTGLLQNHRLAADTDCDPATSREHKLVISVPADGSALAAPSRDQSPSSEAAMARRQDSDALGVSIKQEVVVDSDDCADNEHKDKKMTKVGKASIPCSVKPPRANPEPLKQNHISHKSAAQEVLKLHSKVGAGVRLQAAIQHLQRPMKKPPHALTNSAAAALSIAHAQVVHANTHNRIPSTSKAAAALPLSVQRGHLLDKQGAPHHRIGAPWTCVKTQLQSVNSHHASPVAHPDSSLHAGPRHLLRCGQCGMCFPHPSNLKSHMQTHTGERPFCCSLCGRSFTKLSNLKAHRRVHTGERPYCCLACGKRFTQKCNLKRHQRIHLDV